MKTKEEILEDIFYKPETQDWYKPVVKAMELYANEKLKGLWEEVNLFAQVFEQKSESAEDEGKGCHLSGRAAAYKDVRSRIEELLKPVLERAQQHDTSKHKNA